ncbi:MAG: Vgb family protein [Candidatus Electronema sp. V4]|uniref:Vgb family protein n=1 Tax=Candidatus Electronema sp. V4 TaxID=3454756 RepID=UPI0040555C5D
MSFTLMLAALACMTHVGTASAEERTWTLDADFDEGTIVNLNHDPNHDQLQLNDFAQPFRFINIPASSRGTVVRVNTDTGEILGEYRTAPEGRGLSPSRTTVDIRGNVWTANRAEGDENGDDRGSAVKIGIVVGGTRCNRDGSPNPVGDYVKLEPSKLTYNTCVDRNGDGLIRTSKGLGDYLLWPDNGDGEGGANGGDARVQDAEDECILIYQRLPDAPGARHVSVDRQNNVWVAGHPYKPKMFYKLDETTGAIIDKFDARVFGCGGYGGLVSDNNFDNIIGNDILWSASACQKSLLRYDLSTRTGLCIDLPQYPTQDCTSYGLAVDNNGFVWNNLYSDHTITKLNPATAQQLPGFPVPTGGELGRGVAVTADNTIWSANTATHTVSRLDANGNILEIINVGISPTGVSVDYAGKVWVTNLGSNNAMRIDPATNQVDLTVDLGGAGAVGGPAAPYTYSDMTGSLRLGHPPIGFWNVVYDGGCNTLWDRISWNNGQESESENPATNSVIKVEIRVAATKAGLAGEPFQTVTNGADLTGMKGQFIEVRTSFISEAPAGQRDLPVLKDLTVSHHPLDMTVNIPDQKYSFGFAPIDLDDFISFNPAGDWFNDVVWSYSPQPLPAGWSVTIDDNHVATVTGPPNETNGPPSETRDLPITFHADLPWGGDQCGVSDEVVFIANHPPVLCPDMPPPCLWSPNHKGDDKGEEYSDVPLIGYVCDPDGDAVTARILSITSDEPTSKNNGDPAPDADPNCIGTDTAQLRPERDGKGDGRVYMVTFVASDGRGGETTMTLPVRVPHNQTGCNAVDSGQKYDATK